MARDGLVPPLFARLHPRYCTPWGGTIALALGMATAAAFLPITLLGDLVSLGTALGFTIIRSEEHTSELQSLMRISYAVFCLKKKKKNTERQHSHRLQLSK